MTDSDRDERVVFLDLETTGLDPKKDYILEIAVVVARFTALDSAYVQPEPGLELQQVINVPGAAAFMDDFVRQMHTDNQLIYAVQTSNKSCRSTEADVIVKLLEWGFVPGKTTLAGSSVHFDRGFLRESMPNLERFFHHRLLDVSAFRALAERIVAPNIDALLRTIFGRTEHRALPDCMGSIEELSLYLQHFVDPAGFWAGCLSKIEPE